MPYEFITKNGLISQGNVTVTGSLITSQNVTASNISVSATGSFGVVGIGTTIPTQKLSLATGGNLSFQNTLGATGNYGAIYSYNDLVNTTTPATAIRFIRDISNIGPDGAIAFDTNNTERIRVTSANGYVGIGTTTPNNKLHVYNSAGSSTTASNAIAIFEQSSNAGIQVCVPDASEAGLFFSRNGAAYYSAITRNGTDLLLKNNSTTAVTINSSGNVGIGTTSVNFKLDIWGATGTTLNMANVDDSGRGGKLTFISSSAAGRQFFVGTNSSIYNLVFGIDSIEKMRIDTSGNVGINITNPTTKLHVSGSITALDGAFVSNVTSGTDKYFLNFYGTATNQIFTLYENSSTAYLNSYNSMAFRANQLGGSGGYFVFSGANVGIGTSIPVAPLDVVGSTLTAILRNSTAASYGGLRIYNDQNSSVRALEIDYAGSTYAGSLVTNGPTGESAAITTTGAYPLVFGTSNTARMTILSGGNVGIGSTSPSSKFEVLTSAVSLANQPNIIANFRGDTDGRSLIRVDNTSTSAGAAALQSGISFVAYSNVSSQPSANKHEAQIILGSTGATSVPGGQTGTLQIIAPQDIAFNVSASNIIMTGSSYTTFGYNAMYITRAGNIGIGTTNPSSRLHISGSSATAITITDDVLYTNSISNDNSVMTYTVDTGNAAAASAAHVFKRFNTELVRIDPSGDVGIGTSVPGALLDVSYGDYQNAGTIRMGADLGINTSRTNATRKWGLITGYNYTNASAAIPIIGYDSANTYTAINIGGGTSAIAASPTYISFYTTSSLSTYGTERVRIDSSGLVGIGTTNPSYLIDVYKTSNDAVIRSRTTGAGAYVYLDSATDGWYGINMLSGSTSRWFVGSYGTSDFTITRGLGSSEYVRVTTTGNVGIGTANPTSKLNVSGSTGGVFEVDTAGGVTSLYVSASGDVGIGTNAPTTQTNYRFLSVNSSAAGSSVIETLVNGVRIGGMEADSSNFYLESIGSYPIVFRTAVNEKMRITAAGNVGIGTSSPAQKLEIQSGSVLLRGDGSALFGTYYASAGENTFFTLHSGSGNTFHIGNDVAGTNYNTIVLSAATDSTGGKVGIGTSNPGSKLQINDNTPTLTIRANDGGTSRKAYIDFYTTFFNYPSDVGARRTSTIVTGFDSGVWGTEFLAFNVGSGSANDAALLPIERVRIDGSGNVGIGTTVPTARLHVSGSTGGVFEVDTAGGATTFYVSASGNVGIGTTNPVAKLHVIGNISGSSFTSSVSNAVGFLGTSSWAQNVVSASYATTAQTANALNTGNSYTIAGLTNNGTLSQQGTLSMGSGYQILATTGTTSNPGIAFVGDTNTGIYSSGADTIGLVTGGSEKVTINSTGNVGIGTTSPGAKLDVVGGINSSTANNFNITSGPYNAVFYNNSTSSTDYNAIRIYQGASGSAVGYFGTGGSATGNVSFRNTFVVGTQNSNDFVLNTTDTERVRITSGGNVGIGTTNPVAKLQVAGNVSGSSFTSSISNAVGFLGTSSWAQNVVSASFATTAQTANALNASNTYTIAGLTSAYVDVNGSSAPTTGIYRPSTKTLGLSADGTLIFKISNVSAPATSSIETGNFLVQSGNVGIGTTNATDKLTVYGALASYKTGADTIQTQVYLANGGNTRAFNLQLNSGGTGLDLWSYNSANAWLRHTTFDYDGRVGIGTAAPVAKFEISGSSNSALMNIKSPISGAILYVSGSGAVGIGTSNVGAYTLQVNGSFGATTKSFVIDHPTKEGKKLIYGSLESPYHGIRLTGRDTLKEGKCKIQLPDYIYKLILHDSVNIQLTGIKCNKTLYVDDINVPENYFTIAYDKAIFETYKDYDFFWDFTAIRADVPELITEL